MYEPWNNGEYRVTPCCNANALILDNTQPGGPHWSRWECDECHRVWCWGSLVKPNAIVTGNCDAHTTA